MRAERFVAEHRAGWRRLNELVDKAQRSRLSSLSDEELLEMGALYRRAASDLARAQTRYASTHSGRELVRSLNDLVLRAHTQVYSAPPARPMRASTSCCMVFPPLCVATGSRLPWPLCCFISRAAGLSYRAL
jgi:hypothetical protein